MAVDILNFLEVLKEKYNLNEAHTGSLSSHVHFSHETTYTPKDLTNIDRPKHTKTTHEENEGNLKQFKAAAHWLAGLHTNSGHEKSHEKGIEDSAFEMLKNHFHPNSHHRKHDLTFTIHDKDNNPVWNLQTGNPSANTKKGVNDIVVSSLTGSHKPIVIDVKSDRANIFDKTLRGSGEGQEFDVSQHKDTLVRRVGGLLKRLGKLPKMFSIKKDDPTVPSRPEELRTTNTKGRNFFARLADIHARRNGTTVHTVIGSEGRIGHFSTGSGEGHRSFSDHITDVQGIARTPRTLRRGVSQRIQAQPASEHTWATDLLAQGNHHDISQILDLHKIK